VHTSFYSYATAVQEDTLELIVKQELAAAEEKYKDELFKLDQKYDGGRWNLYDADGHYRVNITSKNSWDREYAKSAHPVDPYYPSQDEWDNLYDDLHDDDYCHDCGSRMCSGNCRQIMDDDPLELRGSIRVDNEVDNDDEDPLYDRDRYGMEEDDVDLPDQEFERLLVGLDVDVFILPLLSRRKKSSPVRENAKCKDNSWKQTSGTGKQWLVISDSRIRSLKSPNNKRRIDAVISWKKKKFRACKKSDSTKWRALACNVVTATTAFACGASLGGKNPL